MSSKFLDFVVANITELAPTEIVSGGADGADTLASLAASKLMIPVVVLMADWKKDGKAAGPIRNQKMLDQKPDLVLAFFPSAGCTKGTLDMIRRAQAAKVPVKMVTYEEG